VTSAKHTRTTAVGSRRDRMAGEIHDRVGLWLQTREGIASASVSFVVFLILLGLLSAPLLTALIVAAFSIILVSLIARLWESLTAPGAPAFSRISDALDGSVELQHDPNAGFWTDSRGFLWGDRVWFAGSRCPPCRIRPDTYRRLHAWCDQEDLPVFIARARQRQWWWWRNAFYWESGDYEPEDVAALLEMRERNDEEALGWELDVQLAEPIPEDVKQFVLERDRGRCVACGSGELIQYDHVVPASMGGGNEPKNIQLLCAACNRR
jgi:hypothetical protein